jgi:HD-like signal output (HDOD) protein/CheY-like chemotaxis protein
MSKRILFVDDEPMLLSGLERSLRGMRKEWEMEFAPGGSQALEAMARAPFDVVVTDMRMPEMDGAELLEQIKAKYPRTMRFVLSGQSDRETILRSIGPTHQYLSKPCDLEELKQKVAQALALRELLENPTLKEIVSRVNTVPSLPSLYVSLTEALRQSDITVAKIAHIVKQDMGMTSKVLQLVNSAFFALPCHISSPQQAISLLGIDNIRAVVLSVHVFAELEENPNSKLAALWPRSLATAAFARAIARAEHSPQALEDDAFAAGLLHDIGRLVLASGCSTQYAHVLEGLQRDKVTLAEAEWQSFGCTHAEVGAYLLGLWGLPDAVVQAVAWHHTPSRSGTSAFSPVIAVHAAVEYDHRLHPDPENVVPALDETLLAKLGLLDRTALWWNLCQELNKRGEHNDREDSSGRR